MSTPQGPAGPPPGYSAVPQPGPARRGQPQPGPPPQGPAPGYGGPPPGYGASQLPPEAQRPGGASGQTAVWLLGAVSVLCVAAGLSVEEDGHNAWSTVNAWGGLAIAGAVLSAACAFGSMFGLTPQRAWQLSVAGAVALVLFWVLFVLPSVGSNTSLVTTIGVAAGVFAVWIASGRQRSASGAQPPQRW